MSENSARPLVLSDILMAVVVASYVDALMRTTSCRGDAADITGHDCQGENCDTSLRKLYDPEAIFSESYDEIKSQVRAFVADNPDDVRDWVELHSDDEWLGAEDLGYNLVLSRNGEGAGFWDRERGALGDRLHKAAVALGETNLYVGDDGELYV